MFNVFNPFPPSPSPSFVSFFLSPVHSRARSSHTSYTESDDTNTYRRVRPFKPRSAARRSLGVKPLRSTTTSHAPFAPSVVPVATSTASANARVCFRSHTMCATSFFDLGYPASPLKALMSSPAVSKL